MTNDITTAAVSILRRALTDDDMIAVAHALLSELATARGAELDLTLGAEDLAAAEAEAHESMLARAFEAGEVIWDGDMLVESKKETFWLPTPKVGARVEVTVHLSNGTHTIVGELVGVSKLGVVVRDEATGNRHHLPGLAANNVRVLS